MPEQKETNSEKTESTTESTTESVPEQKAKKNSVLTSLDLHFLTEELKEQLADSKIDKIYQQDSESFLFQLHIPNKGRKILNIFLPGFIFLSDEKQETPETPSNFSLHLRKQLSNARIRNIRQHSFERVLEITFEKMEAEKKQTLYLILELFSKGNLVLADSKYRIISSLKTQNLKSRAVKKNEIYIFPEKKYNFLEIKKEEMEKAVETSEKDSVVKLLATELSLGGEYSESICSLAGIDKSKKTLDNLEFEKLWNSIEKFRKEKHFENYNVEFQKRFEKSEDKKLIIKKESGKTAKIRKIIEMQRENIEKLEQEILNNNEKADFIYANYQEILSIITDLNEARKKHSWNEIKEKLKGNKKIKSINEKDSKIVIDL